MVSPTGQGAGRGIATPSGKQRPDSCPIPSSSTSPRYIQQAIQPQWSPPPSAIACHYNFAAPWIVLQAPPPSPRYDDTRHSLPALCGFLCASGSGARLIAVRRPYSAAIFGCQRLPTGGRHWGTGEGAEGTGAAERLLHRGTATAPSRRRRGPCGETISLQTRC
jgi:hypothetical protein